MRMRSWGIGPRCNDATSDRRRRRDPHRVFVRLALMVRFSPALTFGRVPPTAVEWRRPLRARGVRDILDSPPKVLPSLRCLGSAANLTPGEVPVVAARPRGRSPPLSPPRPSAWCPLAPLYVCPGLVGPWVVSPLAPASALARCRVFSWSSDVLGACVAVPPGDSGPDSWTSARDSSGRRTCRVVTRGGRVDGG